MWYKNKMIIPRLITICLVILLLVAPTAGSAKSTQRSAPSSPFSIPRGLEPEVQFWTDIYSKHDSNHVVIHDKRYLQVVYGVVSLADLASPLDPMPESIRKARSDRVEKETAAIRGALLSIAASPNRRPQTALEKKVDAALSSIKDPNKYSEAADNLRSQTGQKDKFEMGLRVSGRYMPYFESIYQQAGLPIELTRLVFVESMFNLRARSKVGASGLWQFMPGTGRLYMSVNDTIDERNDPITATHGATKLLKKNYEFLGSWPLAINAYNSGPGRLKQARERFGHDIVAIIHQFNHPSYGFASRNFYPSFLAALNVYNNRTTYFPDVIPDPKLEWDTVTVKNPALMPQLASYTQTDLNLLRDLNPALHDRIATGKAPLPVGYSLRIPAKTTPLFASAFSNIPSDLAKMNLYIAVEGDSIAEVARQFRVTENQLRALNDFPGEVLPGQVIKIPVKTKLASDKGQHTRNRK